MAVKPPYPSFETPETMDDFFVAGRNLWPDLASLKDLKFDREQIPPEIVQFLRSTALNEHGVAHYLGAYFANYRNDFKLRFWSAMWTAEEYTHYIVLRRICQGLDADLTEKDFAGLEEGNYFENMMAYLERIKVDPSMDMRMLQLIYGVLQEYGAVIAYTAAAEQCGNPEIAALLKRVAKDEMRHCRFNQVALEGAAYGGAEFLQGDVVGGNIEGHAGGGDGRGFNQRGDTLLAPSIEHVGRDFGVVGQVIGLTHQLLVQQ